MIIETLYLLCGQSKCPSIYTVISGYIAFNATVLMLTFVSSIARNQWIVRNGLQYKVDNHWCNDICLVQ